MGNHKTITHQNTVNVQRSYTCTQVINSLYTTYKKVIQRSIYVLLYIYIRNIFTITIIF